MILNVINPFLHHPLVMLTLGSTDRGGQWFNSLKGKINRSKASTALGWYGKKAMLDYWNQILRDLQGLPTKSGESNLAMLWGSINEDSTLVFYLKNVFPKEKTLSKNSLLLYSLSLSSFWYYYLGIYVQNQSSPSCLFANVSYQNYF